MNGPAALIAAGIGALFFAAATTFYYQPAFIPSDYALDQILTTNHSKARAAVKRLLHDAASAKFDVMRSVDVDTGKYVCGSVNAKDRSGAYAGNKAFVYTVANDFARIDDDGQIAQRHVSYKLCPLSEEEERVARLKLTISPGAIEMAKKLKQVMPAADESVLTDLSSQLSAGRLPSGLASGQAVGRAMGASGSGGGPSGAGAVPSGAPFKATVETESEWRADRPPSAWPAFAADHPLARLGEVRSPAEALALAKDVETGWARFKLGETMMRPSVGAVQGAQRALLGIDPTDERFAQAWAAFVRLRKIERDMRA
jgi:hypothetical protein